MFGRNRNGVVADVAETAAGYGEQLVEDKKVRDRVVAAVAAGLAARERAKRQAGLVGLGRRLANDPVLRAQLREAVTQLQKAQRRAERKQSHRLRNTTLVLSGFGAASAVLAVPTVRERLLAAIRRGKEAATRTRTPTAIVEAIDVEVPVREAYDQWTQFEQFPQFMEGVDEVRQLDDTLLHWSATVAGRRADWYAKIVEQEPDRRITWESTDGRRTRGTVTFSPVGPQQTRIELSMSYIAEGPLEHVGSAAGLDARRVRGDLVRFKELIESRGFATGAWRGEIHSGVTTAS